MGFLPKLTGHAQRLDLQLLPPGSFVASLVQLPMMAAAEGNRELITDLHAERTRLCKAQVMRIARVTSADNAWLRRYKSQMRFIAPASGFSERKDAFVNRAARSLGNRGRQRGSG